MAIAWAIAQGWRPRLPVSVAWIAFAVVILWLTVGPSAGWGWVSSVAGRFSNEFATVACALLIIAIGTASVRGRRSWLAHPWMGSSGDLVVRLLPRARDRHVCGAEHHRGTSRARLEQRGLGSRHLRDRPRALGRRPLLGRGARRTAHPGVEGSARSPSSARVKRGACPYDRIVTRGPASSLRSRRMAARAPSGATTAPERSR